MMIPTQHEKAEWARCAKEMYRVGRTQAGHSLSAGAALPRGASMESGRFDALQTVYRAWMVFNKLPALHATCSAEVADFIDPAGTLRRVGLLSII